MSVHREFFRLRTDMLNWPAVQPHYCILPDILYSWLKHCDRCFASTTFKPHSVSLFSAAQKMFLLCAQNVLIHHFFLISFVMSAFRPNRCSSYSVYFGLLDCSVCGCLQYNVSWCSAVSTYRHFVTQPEILTPFYFLHVLFGHSDQEFWELKTHSTFILPYTIPLINLLKP